MIVRWYADRCFGAWHLPQAYWIYWSVMFATLLTWVFAVVAAADDAWLSNRGVTWLALGEACVTWRYNNGCELCECSRITARSSIFSCVSHCGRNASQPSPLTICCIDIITVSDLTRSFG